MKPKKQKGTPLFSYTHDVCAHFCSLYHIDAKPSYKPCSVFRSSFLFFYLFSASTSSIKMTQNMLRSKFEASKV